MPVNVADSITYTATVQSVADGDAATQANFLLAPQALANRTAFLRDLITNPLTGASAIRGGTTAQMSALAGMTDGSLFLAKGFGLYRYDAASVIAADGLLSFVANGSGRWLHLHESLANAALGFAVIGTAGGSAGKIPVGIVPNGIVAVRTLLTAGQQSVASASMADIPGFTLDVPNVLAGDLLIANWNYFARGNGGAGLQAAVREVVVDPTATAVNNGTYFTVADAGSANPDALIRQVIFVAANSGTHTFKLQGSSGTSTGVTVSTTVRGLLSIVQFRS